MALQSGYCLPALERVWLRKMAVVTQEEGLSLFCFPVSR